MFFTLVYLTHFLLFTFILYLNLPFLNCIVHPFSASHIQYLLFAYSKLKYLLNLFELLLIKLWKERVAVVLAKHPGDVEAVDVL